MNFRSEPEMRGNQTAAPAIAVAGVNYTFAKSPRPVLRGIDLSLRRGEFVILTGPSGAGKTTLMTLIGALRTMQSGNITVCGVDLANLSAQGQLLVRRKIGFIFQDHNLFDALTAFETLWLTTTLGDTKLTREQALARAKSLLAALGLSEHLHARPGTLSTGQKQRIAIARALINDPSIILADEPTASLDHASSNSVIALIKRHTALGATALMVTHDSRIFGAADRVVHMVDGMIDHVETGGGG